MGQESNKLKCVVISLARATDRRENVRRNLARRSDLDWTFFDALGADAPEVDLPNCPKRQTSILGRPLTPNEIGCTKSHYHVIRQHAESEGWLLVLEDDVWLDPDFEFAESMAFLEAHDLKYLRLFAKRYKPAKAVKELAGFRQIIRFKSDPYGAQAYLIHSDGAKAFVAEMREILKVADDELGRFWAHGLVPLAVFPFPAVERSVPSSLEGARDQANTRRKSWIPELIIHRALEKMRKIYANARLSFAFR